MMDKSHSIVSVIICSVNIENFKLVRQSIERTIGIDHEIIRIDNRETQWGICKAYNHGASIATGDYLCFMHEDVFFKSQDWGKTLVEHISSIPDCGVVGLAGTDYVSRFHAFWWYSGNVVRNFSTIDANNTLYSKKTHPTGTFIPVKILDGFFLFCKKEVWENSPFDETNFPDFHFYDIDFTLSVSNQNFYNYVCNNINVIHLSSGTLALSHYKNAKAFRVKYKDLLPIAGSQSTFGKQVYYELMSAYRLYKYAIKVGASRKLQLQEIKQISKTYYCLLLFSIPFLDMIMFFKKRLNNQHCVR